MSLHLLPGFKQSPAHCGPACLKIILNYYGITASEKELGVAAKVSLELGITDSNLLSAAQEYGLTGEWQTEATIADLRQLVQAGVPTIVEWFSTNESHYSVAVSVTDDEVVIQDPEIGDKRAFSHAEFLAVWFMYEGTPVGGNSSMAYPKSAQAFHVRKLLPLYRAASTL